MREVVAAIHGLTERPTLAPKPSSARPALDAEAGLSILAGRIATHFVLNSEKGRWGDPQLPVDELRKLAAASDDDIAEAVDELESVGWVSPSRALGAGQLGFIRVMPKPALFAALDAFLMPWNPEEDARTVAAALVNSQAGSFATQRLAADLGWSPRRMNPAITLLIDRGLVEWSETIDPDYQSYYLRKNVQTRRFLRDG